MCGFVGTFASDRSATPDPEGCAALLARLRHRGPDQAGVQGAPGFVIGAARLAVQGDARADQPLEDPEGRFLLAFNGEILGTEAAALRRLVAAAGLPPPPAEAGDGPLLVAAVAALRRGLGALAGPSLLQLIEGAMGAFALFDRQADELWLVRDRLGVKPLFVASDDDGSVRFASEITPLLLGRGGPVRLDPDGLGELLHLQRPQRCLPFAGVEALPPGAAWRVRRGGRVTRWVGGLGIRDLEDRASLSAPEAVEALREALARSAREAAAVDGPCACFLSGGLDSGAVFALAGRDDLLGLTGRFAPPGGLFDESSGAAAVARAVGRPHEVLDLADGDLLADLPAVVRALEVPMAGPGSLALWRLARHLAGRTRVLLTGTGGDELLGGYARTAILLGRDGAWTAGYEPLARRLAGAADLAGRQRLLLDRAGDLVPLLDPDFLASLPAFEAPGGVARRGAEADRAAAELVLDEVEGTLPMLLHVDDRVTMAHGLEGRPPFLLGDVPAAAAKVPVDWLVGPDGEGKRALRAALEGVLPDVVRTDPRKRGFPTPFARAARGRGRSAVEAVFGDRRFGERGWWNVAACRRALDEERPAHDRALWVVLSWEFWARAFLDGDALGPPEVVG